MIERSLEHLTPEQSQLLDCTREIVDEEWLRLAAEDCRLLYLASFANFRQKKEFDVDFEANMIGGLAERYGLCPEDMGKVLELVEQLDPKGH